VEELFSGENKIPKPASFNENSDNYRTESSARCNGNSAVEAFVVLLPLEWKTYHRRPHWQSQAEISEVLAIEPPAGLLVFWKHFSRIKAFIHQRFKIRRGDGGIMFYRPISLVSYGVGYRFRLFAIIDRFIIKYQLRRMARKLDIEWKRMAFIIANSWQYYLGDIFPEMVTCYEVTDEYSVVPGETQVDYKTRGFRMSLRADKRLLSVVDAVFTSSLPLNETYSRKFPNTYYLPNGANFKHFSRANNVDTVEPPDLKVISSPRIGYIGSIINTFDFDLMYSLATSGNDWSFVIIGGEKVSDKFNKGQAYKAIRSLSNVHFLGFKDYETLPAYLKGMDVCLLPHKRSVWMDNSCPNKVFQYLSAGKPVVSTDFESIRELADVVYIAENATRFRELIEYSLGKGRDEAGGKRIEIARRYSTESRARLLLKVLTDLAGKKS
jgi:glycosyltransferase involved in cell wall biosynthesis